MQPAAVGAEWLAQRIAGRKADEIGSALSDLILSGDLRVGTRLPTIRQLAGQLDAKQSTITSAWGVLRRDGLVETSRRGGTRVSQSPAGARFRSVSPGWHPLDLVHAQPDAELLPDIGPHLVAALRPDRRFLNDRMVTAELASVVRARWPYDAERFTVAPGGVAALLAIIDTRIRDEQDVIALEAPALEHTATTLSRLARRVVGVHTDNEGPIPDSLADALSAGARLFVLQPSSRIPTGGSLTDVRADELAEVLDRHPEVWILEEDSLGPLTAATTLGSRFPQRTVRITQYWRAYGVDLDLAVIGGPRDRVERIREYQRRTGSYASALLQDALAMVIEDPLATSTIDAAAETYTARHRAFARALQRAGLVDESIGGLFAWIAVDDEARAVSSLNGAGIHVAAGSDSFAGEASGGHIRISTTSLPDDTAALDEIAMSIALAMRGGVGD